ncbi:MAG: hypothetical protein AB7I19_18415 [Planctomycetota bacterium]
MSKKGKKGDAEMNPFDDDGDFIEPPMDEAAGASGDDDEFGDPTSEDADSSPHAEAIVSMCAAIESKLLRAAEQGARAANYDTDGPNIVGVGSGSGDDESGLVLPGERALVIYLEDDSDEDEVRRELVDSMGVQAASDDDVPIQLVTTGVIEAQSSNRSKFRPAPAGVSVGHYAITAGTIGGWTRGNGARSNRLLMLSNNHVLANSNRGKNGDAILQPGKADGGVNPRDRIAILERFVPIAFGSGKVNYVDCATGWCWPKLVRRDWVYHVGSTPKYFKCAAATVEPSVNRIVGKSGRTTNLTQGRITATGVSINVNFGAAGVAHFRDQFAVRSTGRTDFSAGGDSGSFVWTWDSRRCPVGLLFAGGGGTTFCNRMSRVLKALDIRLL